MGKQEPTSWLKKIDSVVSATLRYHSNFRYFCGKWSPLNLCTTACRTFFFCRFCSDCKS